jgi:hypothetical protein
MKNDLLHLRGIMQNALIRMYQRALELHKEQERLEDMLRTLDTIILSCNQQKEKV